MLHPSSNMNHPTHTWIKTKTKPAPIATPAMMSARVTSTMAVPSLADHSPSDGRWMKAQKRCPQKHLLFKLYSESEIFEYDAPPASNKFETVSPSKLAAQAGRFVVFFCLGRIGLRMCMPLIGSGSL